MARAAREAFQSDIAIGVTGTMGNVDPENSPSSFPGQVWFAISTEDREVICFKNVEPQPSRSMYKMEVAGLIADELLKLSFEKSNSETLETSITPLMFVSF